MTDDKTKYKKLVNEKLVSELTKDIMKVLNQLGDITEKLYVIDNIKLMLDFQRGNDLERMQMEDTLKKISRKLKKAEVKKDA